MGSEVFEGRWNSLLALRAEGHVELEDFLGHTDLLGALVRAGLMARKEEKCCAYQRYRGHLPTFEGERYMEYVADHHLIVVRGEQRKALRALLDKDPLPDAVYHSNFAPIPILTFGSKPGKLSLYSSSPHDPDGPRAAQRIAQLGRWSQLGYEELERFQTEHRVNAEVLITCGFCRRRDPLKDPHHVAIVPTGEGLHYLRLIEQWDLLLIKPGLALPLLELMDPTQARYWTSCVA